MIDRAMEYVRSVFETDYSGHDFFHTLRVCKMAERLAMEENANLEIVQLAALLHDVDDRKLSPETYPTKENARCFLTANQVDASVIETVCKIINQVSYRGSESIAPDTLEGQCVQDADRLDALGAIGIARTFAFGGNKNRVMYDPAIPPVEDMDEEAYHNSQSHTVNHFYEKLFKLKDLMNTESARQIAVARESYMKDFLDQFFAEWDGIR